MAKVRFVKQFKFSPDGKTVQTCQRGQELELDERWAQSAIKSGAAVAVRKAKRPVEDKAQQPEDNKEPETSEGSEDTK
ncbi:MAG: hypothetical protein GWN86_25970 [Desulfobacterales bacterium]|nr:hypothetical protein [Desulfobacterales bacterium]